MPKSNENGPKSPEIVQAFLGDQIVKNYRGDFYLYNERYYAKVSEGRFRNILASFIQDRFGIDAATKRMVSECYGLLEDLTHIEIKSQPAWLDDPEGDIASVLVLENGILDLSEMYEGGEPRLIPHTWKLFATSHTEAVYKPGVRCPNFTSFLEWFSCGDSGLVLFILQYFAYVLLRTLDLQRCVFLKGAGSNGKSVLLNTLQKLVGVANCSALSIERLGGRFNLAALSDKAVNIAADANEIKKVAEGNLKMLVDGSILTFERKYQNPYESVCYTRLIFACNIFPRFGDRTDGTWRRIEVILCRAKVTGNDIRRGIEDTFDMNGVLNLVLEAGAKLIRDGDFTIPQCVVDATNAERVDANPSMRFFKDRIVLDPDAFLAFPMLYAHYSSWCEAFGYMAMAENNFGKEFRYHFQGEIDDGTVRHGKSKTRPRLNGYWGIAYAPNGPDDYFEQKEERRQLEAKRDGERVKREAEREASRQARANDIAKQQASGIVQPNDHVVGKSIRDAFDESREERAKSVSRDDMSIMDEIADAIGEIDSDQSTDQGGAFDE